MKKVGHNMFLDGNKFFSFVTHVATIEGSKMIEHGKYSQTTSKHIRKYARLHNLEVIESEERPDFEMLWAGVKIKLNK